MSDINNLTRRLKSYLPADQVTAVRAAYDYADKAHAGQYRRSGEAYISHPLAVAHILTDMRMDYQSLMAALLHDVLEDTPTSKEEMGQCFGEDVANLVDGVSKITQMSFPTQAEKQAANFRKMILAMTKDVRVILVKLADRLHNMRTLGSLAAEKRRRIATETLDIYSPIANRLGMNTIRIELQDLGFNALYPMRSSLIAKEVRKSWGGRRELIASIKASLEKNFDNEGIEAKILGREKHLYSIYMKMKEKSKSFSEIMDVYGFRIVVENVDTCYRVLGVVHNLYKPVPGQFKDYIAIPKANGYQSLHTVLKGHQGVPIEIQIRTREMEDMANNGIAAHWLYKADEEETSSAQARTRQWMKGLLELQQQAGNSLEFIENVKVDLFPDEVYVFSPKGKILELPKGATAVDFAYAIHTNIGDSCVAARINQRLTPLSTPLLSGETVEVITAPHSQPNPAWLNFVVTGKARASIRHYLKNQQQSDSIKFGRSLLEKALLSMDRTLAEISDADIVEVVQALGCEHFDELLQEIGLGNQVAQLVALRFADEKHQGSDMAPFAITGSEGVLLNYARCCTPLPGDPVFGFLSAGKGIVVHRSSCNNLLSELRNHPEKCFELHWDDSIGGEFTAELRVELVNKRGVLAALAAKIAEFDTNIEYINMEERDAAICVVKLLLSVKNRVHLAQMIKNMRVMSNVGKITRAKA